MFSKAVYSCPVCQHPWPTKLVWRHSLWSPIICPGCSATFHYEKRQWFRMTAPLCIMSFLLVINTFWLKGLLGSHVFLLAHPVLLMLAHSVLLIGVIVSGWWWWRGMQSKLKFVSATNT